MKRIFCAIAVSMLAWPVQADIWEDCGNRKNPAGMLTACTKLIADDSTTPKRLSEAYLYRCQAKDMQGDPNGAVGDCLTARALNPDDSSIYNSLTIVLVSLGRHNEAVKAADKGLELKPGDGNYWNGRAIARCAAGLHEGAYKDRLKALELGRFTPEGLQRAMANRGYYKGAIDGNFNEGSKNALWRWTQNGCK